MKSRCVFAWSWLAVLSIYYKSCLIKLLNLHTLCTKVKDTKLPMGSLGFVNLDTVLCPRANMALWRGWKGEAEEAIRIKEDFANIPAEVSQEKHRRRPRQLHAFCGKKGGEESHWDAVMHGPRGKQLPRGNNYCTMRTPAEVGKNLLFIRSVIYVPQSRPR